MIYTVTLNPALDRTLWVEELQYGESNHIVKDKTYAGGKGIDVSKVLSTLGVPNRALAFVGGFAGEELEGGLVNHGIQCDFIRISQETRTNIVINDESRRIQTSFNALGPELKPYELMRMIHKIEKLDDPEIVVISGSLPPGAHPEIYRKMIEIAKNRGGDVFLDTHGDGLRRGIEACPLLIKPNLSELSQFHGVQLERLDDIINSAMEIQEAGVEMVLVSMGAKGILLITEKEKYVAAPPDMKVVNTIGAGDSSVAGFIYGLKHRENLKECLKCAVAAGTATTMRSGTALCRKDDVQSLIPKITIKSY